ncbi:MAG TPA: hypothetical protein VK821_06145 [Dehalococcoidia bacterium]|nr:hypothetical protein [Dehalococcoidia bacterium]
MNIRNHARTLAMASLLVAAVSTSAGVARFASAAPVNQTGPTGAQCHLNGMDGDFADPDHNDRGNPNDATNPSNAALEGGPRMQVAGCGLFVNPGPPPTPTPAGDPIRKPVRLLPAGFAPGS